VFHRDYFVCLTYSFAVHPQRYRRFWQAPIFYYNNIWQVPAPLRLPHSLGGLNHLARLTCPRPRAVFPQSTYSLSLRMAHEVGYWDVDVVPEDWHMFLKCFFNLGGEVDVEAIFLPIYMDGVRSHSYIRTFFSHYQQARRHAWGCSDIPFAIREALTRRNIPWRRRLMRTMALVQNHILWSTQWFMITLGLELPKRLTNLLGITDFPLWFPDFSRMLLTPCLIPLATFVILDTLLRPPRPADFPRWLIPVQYAQWFWLAATTFFFTALPALDAQTRLLLGKRLEYRVTEKA
jgi:hypothetical protein